MTATIRESSKLLIRRSLQRAGLDLRRDSASLRLARTLKHLAVETVLDVGANEGQFAALLRSAGYDGQIESYEPLPTAFHALARRAAKDPRWVAQNMALGDYDGTTTINISANSYSSSILEMTGAHLSAAPRSRVVGSVVSPIRRLDTLMTSLGTPPSSIFLKIDTQGYESPVISGAGDFISEFAGIQLEMSFVELYRGQTLFDELYEFFCTQDMELYGLEAGISNSEGRLLQCDAVFVSKRG